MNLASLSSCKKCSLGFLTWMLSVLSFQHHEAEPICHILPPQEPQEALQCSLTHQEEDHVFPLVQGTPPEIQCEVHAHPQRWRSPGTVVYNGKIAIIEQVFMHLFDFVVMLTTGCPWTLQGSADWQSSTGLQEKVCHLHWACAERKGQWNYSPCWNSPQQGKMDVWILVNFPAHTMEFKTWDHCTFSHWRFQFSHRIFHCFLRNSKEEWVCLH